jgi:hypothetical protein
MHGSPSIVSIAFMALLRWNRKYAQGIGGKRLFEGTGRDTRWIVSDFVRAMNEANRVKLAWVSGCEQGYRSENGPCVRMSFGDTEKIRVMILPWHFLSTYQIFPCQVRRLLLKWNGEGTMYSCGASWQNLCWLHRFTKSDLKCFQISQFLAYSVAIGYK